MYPSLQEKKYALSQFNHHKHNKTVRNSLMNFEDLKLLRLARAYSLTYILALKIALFNHE